MPISGTRDISEQLADAPLVSPATEPVTLERAELLQVMYEIESSAAESLLPPAVHPTDPPVATFVAIRARDSALGSFTLVGVRIGCRAGVRPRGFVLKHYIDDRAAGSALAERWAFPSVAGETSLHRRYDDVGTEVRADGQTILRAALVDPIPLSGAEIQFAASMHLGRVRRDGETQTRLVQVDPELTFHQAARGAPRLDVFEAAAWGDERLVPVYPVSAWFAVCDIALPRVRYLCDPVVPALEGTEKIG